MNIAVNEQPKRFWMATKIIGTDNHEWKSFVGHEIHVGEYTFSIACLPKNILNVSEVTTGFKVFETQITVFDLMFTKTKAETMVFYRDYVGEKLKNIIEKIPNFKERLVEVQNKQKEGLGTMPDIEDVDDILITAPLNNLLN